MESEKTVIDNKRYRDMTRKLYFTFLYGAPEKELDDDDHRVALQFSRYFSYDVPTTIYQKLWGMSEEESNQFFQFTKMEKGFIMAVVIQDLYIKLNHKLENAEISENEVKLFKRIYFAIKKGDYKLLLADIKTINEFINATLEFRDSSAYSKVEAYKELDEEDINLLESVNPNFLAEYQTINIDITQEWIIKQIRLWIKGFKDETLAIRETARFLINAFEKDIDINDVLLEILNSGDDEPETIMQAMLDQDVDKVFEYVKSFYHRKKEKIRELVEKNN